MKKTEFSDYRTAADVDSIRHSFLDNLYFVQARFPEVASLNDFYLALAWTVRDRLLSNWIDTASTYYRQASRSVCYLSAEYLPGPHLRNAMLALGIEPQIRKAMTALGLNLDEIAAQEPEPGLGNGGLGRLAACYLDSLATLQIPAIGYGIRYEFGIFEQAIRDERQVELADKWLRGGNPWEVPRPEINFEIGFGGTTDHYRDESGRYRVRWHPQRLVKGVAYDTPIPGYRVATVNLLRLWNAQACESFNLDAFNLGDYERAVDEKIASETISKVLYPNDEPMQGKRLRLEQEYFFCSCTIQDIIRLLLQQNSSLELLPEKFAIQLNDTHPAIAVAELMRLLIDVHEMDWDDAWKLVRRSVSYTNHTLLPEALETWPVELFGEILPRHLEILYEINRRFLDRVRMQAPDDVGLLARLSLIDERFGRSVRMAHLASVASHTINGVAKLHSRLLQQRVLKDFHTLDPQRFTNVTNGVTPRRFLILANPTLTGLINDTIGDAWTKDLARLQELEEWAGKSDFQAAWREVKLHNKQLLAQTIRNTSGMEVEATSLLDCQIKRFHEYKRQHLNILHIIGRYLDLKQGLYPDAPARTWLFSGKAAPGYHFAKLIIELIHAVANRVNADPDVRDRMRIAFLPNFNVSSAERIYPAADLSEQISTAGMEASGTGNMKFALNGALTIGTLDGANIEIRQRVGAENFFLFGLTESEVATRRAGNTQPRDHYLNDPQLRAVIDAINDGLFSAGDGNRFRPLVENLLGHDHFFVLEDYSAYRTSQQHVDHVWNDKSKWTRASILNTARCGWFSSDRAIKEYCERIWRVSPVAIKQQSAT
ncbi:glycogen/starch/alpha-glucan phosphorylase [Candidatus Thiodiazotropha sp. CDECU1]|uniref:glycogen/starch/alpha-glucan phosphorylase n=1 Tax=Candidatus Thiodiazotropha sp. CDECU1 TaxID=3065865 RepID=UPI0029309BEC|nr:glycogen/starch/alpha-glucan phosphorylase [Candidatus Thiodiazotropha sp. CDECU1]